MQLRRRDTCGTCTTSLGDTVSPIPFLFFNERLVNERLGYKKRVDHRIVPFEADRGVMVSDRRRRRRIGGSLHLAARTRLRSPSYIARRRTERCKAGMGNILSSRISGFREVDNASLIWTESASRQVAQAGRVNQQVISRRRERQANERWQGSIYNGWR